MEISLLSFGINFSPSLDWLPKKPRLHLELWLYQVLVKLLGQPLVVVFNLHCCITLIKETKRVIHLHLLEGFSWISCSNFERCNCTHRVCKNVRIFKFWVSCNRFLMKVHERDYPYFQKAVVSVTLFCHLSVDSMTHLIWQFNKTIIKSSVSYTTNQPSSKNDPTTTT